MEFNPRQEQILSLLQNLRQISVADLTERLGVSQVTIRKDLSLLEEKGLVLRSHGGARLAQSRTPMPNLNTRLTQNQEEKERIVAKARELIQSGDSLCIDAGATNLLLASLLGGMPLRVVTNSLDVLNALSLEESITLISTGGTLRRGAGSFIGPSAVETVKQYLFDIAFIGATSFTADGYFLTQNALEGELKRSVLDSARRRVILAESSKLGARAFSRFAGPDQVDVLITDKGFTQAEALQELGIEVITV